MNLAATCVCLALGDASRAVHVHIDRRLAARPERVQQRLANIICRTTTLVNAWCKAFLGSLA